MSAHMPLDCDEFATELADYLEGDASDAVRSAVESHAAECAACRQLLEDLSTIRHDAAMLPALTPSRDLWGGIAERIDAKVLPLEVARRTTAPARRSWVRPAVAAAALVIVTAGITHLATRASLPDGTPAAGQQQVATSGTVPAVTPSETTTTVGSSVDGEPAAQFVTPSATQRVARSDAPTASTRRAVADPARTRVGQTPASARLASATSAMTASQPVYDVEIVKLRRMLQTRRAQLDPKTIAVLEQSMAVIDSAIAQSRAALASDPASGFLANQLNHSLEKKVELLRTAALLPARS